MSHWLSRNYEKFVERASPPARIKPHRLKTCAAKDFSDQILTGLRPTRKA
jgi:hypothetical protein